jgi:hypothetical protein
LLNVHVLEHGPEMSVDFIVDLGELEEFRFNGS